MKTTILKSCFILMFGVIAHCSSGQSPIEAIKSYPLEITFNKTSSIIFPSIIENVDRGSSDVMVQKVKGIENILQLKSARRQKFPETNLTIVTADGKLFHFIINYSEQPAHLTMSIDNNDEASEALPAIFETKMTEVDFKECSNKITGKERSLKFHETNKYKIQLSLNGIYIKDDVIFFSLEIKNKSNISYDIDMLRFYIQDKQKVKRTASQEVEVKPLYVHEANKHCIPGKETLNLVYALEKFTIPDAKFLVIEMLEKNGGRNLNLSIKNKTIVNARLIPE